MSITKGEGIGVKVDASATAVAVALASIGIPAGAELRNQALKAESMTVTPPKIKMKIHLCDSCRRRTRKKRKK